jgi:hypothetical protein
LIIDYFESQGGKFSIFKNNIDLSQYWIGYGIDGVDDLFLFSLSYANNYAIRYFYNRFQYDEKYSPNDDIKIISADAKSDLNKYFKIYVEGALNTMTYGKGGLVGVRFNFQKRRNKISGNIEYRHYDEKFYTQKLRPTYHYFNSLTVLDKPVNHYYIYYARHQEHNVLTARINGIWFPYRNFFIECDLEPMVGTIELFAYDVSLGLEAVDGVYFRAGLLNKFFVSDGQYSIFDSYIAEPPTNEMFNISNKLWLYLKANFKI